MAKKSVGSKEDEPQKVKLTVKNTSSLLLAAHQIISNASEGVILPDKERDLLLPYGSNKYYLRLVDFYTLPGTMFWVDESGKIQGEPSDGKYLAVTGGVVSPVVHDVWIHADINGGLQFAGFNLLIPMGTPVKVRLPATPQIPYYFAIGGNSWSPRHRTS
ncbi:MAG: hypothetical protein GYA24_06760, partial [Candidatus Lokiarchaeota archaeon]|nr:hypothetical protein [Candidatus Lokiarchaeota archaeon]